MPDSLEFAMRTRNGNATAKIARDVAGFVLFPPAFYLGCFILLTWPLARYFSTDFFCDAGDGLQNVWNIWWVNKSITQLHQLPFYTMFQFYPRGTSLWGHTLCVFNGLVCIGLLRFMSLVQAYNFMIVFSFAASGWTAFLLAYRWSRSYAGSLVAGFIFTFSGYHFSHGQGHMQLTAVEFLPLAILFIDQMFQKPRIAISLAAAACLYLTLLCDYYYFFYACVAALILFVLRAVHERSLWFFWKPGARAGTITFTLAFACGCGTFLAAFFIANHRDPLTLQHDPLIWSADLLAPFIPSQGWRFGELTRWFWSRLPEAKIGWPVHEADVFLGYSVLAMLILMAFKRAWRTFPRLNFWYWTLAIFWVLALGPFLHIAGHRTKIPLPYWALERLLPPLRLSGMPVRMMLMAILAGSVIFACGFKYLIDNKRRVVALCLLLIVVIEHLPAPYSRTSPVVPDYVLKLRDLPGTGGVIDNADDMFHKIYYQTIHQKPLANGYIAREPTSVGVQRMVLQQLLDAGQFDRLHSQYGFDYLVTRTPIQCPQIHLIYRHSGVDIYALGNP